MSDETIKLIEQHRQAIAELQRQISVMEAALEGKTIMSQSQSRWFVCPNPTWLWELTNYKVAPELRTIYMAKYPRGGVYGHPYNTADGCIKATGCAPEDVVKFVEVTE